jgi:zinc transporter ZupT
MNVFEILVLIFSVLGGGGLIFLFGKIDPARFKPILSFSGAFVLGIAILHLLPEVYKNQGKMAGVWILVGFLIQLFLDQFSSGVEHGHVHSHFKKGHNLPLKIMIGLSIHSLIEGIPLGVIGESEEFNHLFWGIVVHKIPAAIALTSVMLISGLNKSMILFCLTLFSIMTPLGAFIGEISLEFGMFFNIVTGIVVGSFFHISTTILYETDEDSHHSFSFKKFSFIFFGFGLSFLTFLLE